MFVQGKLDVKNNSSNMFGGWLVVLAGATFWINIDDNTASHIKRYVKKYLKLL